MPTYRIVTATVTLPIIGTVSRDEKGYIIEQAERYRVHIKAVSAGGDKDAYIVGVLSGSGYTYEPFKESLKVILPDGYDLIAQLVHDAGIPIPQKTLPVATGGGEDQEEPWRKMRELVNKVITERVLAETRPGGMLYRL